MHLNTLGVCAPRIPEPQWGRLLLREGREGPTSKGEEEGREGERDHPKVQVSIIKHCPPMTTSNGKFYIFLAGQKCHPEFNKHTPFSSVILPAKPTKPSLNCPYFNPDLRH